MERKPEAVRTVMVPTRVEVDEARVWWSEDELDLAAQEAVKALREYYGRWRNCEHQDEFYQKRSGKVVLATVACRRQNEPGFRVFFGMNSEISLPDGSLCAERAAIAAAASEFYPACSIAAVAVLDPRDERNPLWPCNVCESWLEKLQSKSKGLQQITVKSTRFDAFQLRRGGEQVLRPLPARLPCAPPNELMLRAVRADGIEEFPWEAQDLVYVHSDWHTPLSSSHLQLLKEAKALGSHLLVGVVASEQLAPTLGRSRSGGDCGVRVREDDLDTRCIQIRSNRHVDSILKAVPLVLTEDFLRSLGFPKVAVLSSARQQQRRHSRALDPHVAAEDRGLLCVLSAADASPSCWN